MKMKQWLPTVLLVLVCVAGFWYVAANDFFVKDEEAMTKGTKELVQFTNEGLQSISIATEKNKLELKSVDGKWTIDGKQELAVNQSHVDGWINTAMLMVYKDVIEEKAKDLGKYGLKPAGAKYVVKRKDKKDIVIEVGSELPTRDFRYVKVGGSNTVYMVNSMDLDNMDKGEAEFVQPELIPVSVGKTVKLTLDWRGNAFQLERVKDAKTGADKWMINGKKELPASEAEAILVELNGWTTDEATRPISEFDTSAPDLKVTVIEETNGQRTTREYIGMIGTEKVWVGEKGTKWVRSILGDTINSYAIKNKNK